MGIRPSWTFLCGIDDLQWSENGDKVTDSRYDGCTYSFGEDIEALEPFPDQPPEDYFYGKFWRDEKYGGWDYLRGKQPIDLIQYFSPCCSEQNSGIVGLDISRLYNKDCQWAITAMDERFMHPGHFCLPHIPSRTFGENGDYLKFLRWRDAGYQFTRDELRKFVRQTSVQSRREKYGWSYPFGYGITMPLYAEAAKYLFKSIGLHVRKRDLKLIFVWDMA